MILEGKQRTVEVFHYVPQAGDEVDIPSGEYSQPTGWYWKTIGSSMSYHEWLEFGGPIGPFDTEREAIDDANTTPEAQS